MKKLSNSNLCSVQTDIFLSVTKKSRKDQIKLNKHSEFGISFQNQPITWLTAWNSVIQAKQQ